MSHRPRTILILCTLILLSLALVACERERPPSTVAPVATTAPRGTVAPTPTPTPPAAATVVSLPSSAGATDAAGVQATPQTGTAATPTAPAPQQVVVNPTGQADTGSGGFFTYSVQAGDTLADIAARYNVTQQALVELNALTDPDALSIGQQLKIPGSASESVGATTPTSGTSVYVIQKGDTLAGIARRFGTTVADLVQLNNLADPDRITVGQKLTVPTAGGAVAPGAPATGGQQRKHVVASGETLLSIARSYGVTVEALQAANNIADADVIYPGQELVIP